MLEDFGNAKHLAVGFALNLPFGFRSLIGKRQWKTEGFVGMHFLWGEGMLWTRVSPPPFLGGFPLIFFSFKFALGQPAISDISAIENGKCQKGATLPVKDSGARYNSRFSMQLGLNVATAETQTTRGRVDCRFY